MTATEAYDSVTNGGANDFAAAVAILEKNPPWCLIGGLAINCYVEPVYTLAADIVVFTKHLAAIKARLLAEKFSIEEFPYSMNARRGRGKLNIQFTTDPRYQDFVLRAAPAEVLGQRVPVAKLADLVRGKLWAWSDKKRRLSKRKKDELDLIRLGEAFPELRAEMPSEIAAQLAENDEA
ncbi:MAG: hypothetical protein ACR2HH_04275 [Chthoniobacterales bacterium]